MTLGPTGQAVRDNIQRLREAQHLTFAELSRRLEAVGNPIPPLGLRRIEAGERKVDVDDLAALAVVLGTVPNYLLMPATNTGNEDATVTGMKTVSAFEVWQWLTKATIPETYAEPYGSDQALEKLTRSLPAWHLDALLDDIKKYSEELSRGDH